LYTAIERAAYCKYHAIVVVVNMETGRVFHNVTLDDLGQIRLYVRETAVARGCELAAIDELIVAVNEAVANIIRHSYQNEPGEIRVIIGCSRDVVEVILLDDGPGFDPTTVPSPDTTLPLAERPFGGMGVHMMRTFCDELRYRRDSRGGNELILLKRIER
jgi:serine/threonine-protein kinase RsbW